MIEPRIKQLRNVLGLTQRDFGKKISLSQNQISSIESGYRKVTERTLRDIAKEFNVNTEWLYSGSEPMFNDVLKDLKIDREVKELTEDYISLTKSQKRIIRDMINELQTTQESE